MKWEKANKDRILAWKNLRRLNNPDDESKDLSNVEILRPYLTQAGAPASFMADAQLPGAMSYGHIPDENWKETFGNLYPESSPLAEKEKEELQAKIRELEGQLAKKDEGPKAKVKKPLSPKQLAHIEKLHRLQMEKKAAAAQPSA